jgi:putative membrane protein
VSDFSDEADARRRLHPVTIFLGWIRRLPSYVFAIPALAVAREGWVVLAVGVGIFLFSIIGAWIAWRTFTYRIDEDALVIERGLIQRSRRAIPLERIQDVSIEQKLLQRLFGVVSVRIETGGSDSDEGTLDSVSTAEAQRLRETLKGSVRAAARPVEISADGEPAITAPETPIFAMSPGRILLFGAFSFSLVWMAALFGIFQFVDDLLPIDRDDVERWIDSAGAQASAGIGVMLVLAVVLFLLVLGFLSGLVATFIREFGFRLTLGEGRFRRVRGLLTRSEVVIAIRRIQLAVIQRPLVSGMFGYAGLQFQSLGGSNDKGGRQEMAPFATDDEIGRIIDAAGMPQFETPGMKPVAFAHVIRAFVSKAVPFIIAVAAVGSFVTRWALLGLIAVPVIVGVSLLLRRFHRYALRPASLQVMRGVLKRRDWVVPYASVQVVTVRRGPLQRLLGVATVQVDTAGAQRHRPNVEDAHLADAVDLANELIARA